MTGLKKWIAGVMTVFLFTAFLPQLAHAGQKGFWLDNKKEDVTAQSIEMKSSPLRKIPVKEEKSYKWMYITGGIVLVAIIAALAGSSGGSGPGPDQGTIKVNW